MQSLEVALYSWHCCWENFSRESDSRIANVRPLVCPSSIAQNTYCLSKSCLLIIMPINHKAHELSDLISTFKPFGLFLNDVQDHQRINFPKNACTRYKTLNFVWPKLKIIWLRIIVHVMKGYHMASAHNDTKLRSKQLWPRSQICPDLFPNAPDFIATV